DEPARDRAHDRRADAEAGRDEGDGETAMPGEPARGRRGQGCVEAAGGEADDHTEDELELDEAGRLARRHQPETEQDTAGQHDGTRAEPAGQRAPDEAAEADAEPVA